MHLTFDAPIAGVLSTLFQYALGPAFVVLVGWVLDRRFKKRQAEVKHSITNEHTDHLRDDLDSKFGLVFHKLDYVVGVQKKQGRAIIAMRRDIADLYANDAEKLTTRENEIIELEKELDKEV